VPACASCGYQAVEAFKFCPECGAAAVARTSEQRKVVTVLFCDVVGSTALGESTDPEAVRTLLARYFERMKKIIERHDGAVEKFIGDAVMAVFGVPAVHEDDALRACRTAVGMREALLELDLEGRIGIATGEVVTGTEERLATGDAVNVGSRLQHAAQPGEALISAETRAHAGAAVDVEAVEALTLKGKADPVPAYRLLGVHEAAERRPEARFVGRESELASVREAWERVLTERRCELLTVVGEAGVGKSRLIAEALGSLDGRVVQGRCLPYGEGITYWPVVEILRQLRASPPDEAAAVAIGSLLGEVDVATSADEIAWAFRKTLEHAAAERPLIVVFDDVQWGEETFLNLLEHVALFSSGTPILLLAMSRPELLDRRASWPVTVPLEPLPDEEAEELIPERIAGELRARIARASGGNPLFLEEMVAMAGEAGGEVVVPPTLQAVVAARLDQLDPAERTVLERGAVEGEVFHRGAVQALAPEATQITPRLAALVRKGLIRTNAPQLAGEDAFRFRHLLIRDIAYSGLPKAVRAGLHERLAAWLEKRETDLVELEEILGYHLERAWLYRDELGQGHDPELAAVARGRLTSAGRRALTRQDTHAATNLLARAAALVPEGEVDVPLELSFVLAFGWAGKGREAARRAGSVAERAAAAGDRLGELCARLEEGMQRVYLEPEGAVERLAALAEEALPVFEAAGDDFALHVAYRALGHVANAHGQMDALVETSERAAYHAQRMGLPNQHLLAWCEVARFHGTTPASELLARQDERDAERLTIWLRRPRAGALAMLGRIGEARTLLAEIRADRAGGGGGLLPVSMGMEVEVELLAGDPAAAVVSANEAYRLLEKLEHHNFLAPAAGWLGQANYALGRLDEATAWADLAAELPVIDNGRWRPPGDLPARRGSSSSSLAATGSAAASGLWRQVKAKVLARRGEHAEAERLARQAVEISNATDMLNQQGAAYADLAEVLALAGRSEAEAEALEQALARYERKENIVMAERVRARLAELRPS
jgi:class 3 adenylate cyclase/tetratricopeptide (TPR) repeat protein